MRKAIHITKGTEYEVLSVSFGVATVRTKAGSTYLVNEKKLKYLDTMTPTLREKIATAIILGQVSSVDVDNLVKLIESERQAAYEEGAKAMAEECEWELSVEFNGPLEKAAHDRVAYALADVIGKEEK